MRNCLKNWRCHQCDTDNPSRSSPAAEFKCRWDDERWGRGGRLQRRESERINDKMNRVPRNQLGFGFGPHALSSRSPGGSWRTREKLDLRRTGAALIPPRSHRDLKTAERRAVGPISILVRHLPLYLVLKILFPVLSLPHSSFVYCRPWLLIMYLRLRLHVHLFFSYNMYQ